MKYLMIATLALALATTGAYASPDGHGDSHDEPVVVDTHTDDEDTHTDEVPEVELDDNGNPMHGEVGHDHEVHHL